MLGSLYQDQDVADSDGLYMCGEEMLRNRILGIETVWTCVEERC